MYVHILHCCALLGRSGFATRPGRLNSGQISIPREKCARHSSIRTIGRGGGNTEGLVKDQEGPRIGTHGILIYFYGTSHENSNLGRRRERHPARPIDPGWVVVSNNMLLTK